MKKKSNKKSPRPPFKSGRLKKKSDSKTPRLPRRGGQRTGWSRSAQTPAVEINLGVNRIGEGVQVHHHATWMIQDVLAWDGTGVLTAPPKSGKTYLLAQIAEAILTGSALFDRYAVHKTGPVIFYSPELKQAELEKRFAEICKRRDVDPKALNLYINDQYGIRLELIRHQAMIEENVARIRPALVIFDPLSRCYGGGLNSEKGLHKMTEFLIRLSRQYECAVLLAHHSAKRTGSQHVFGGKGSGVLSAFGASNMSIIPTGHNRSELQTSQRFGSPITIHLRLDGEEGGRCVVAEDPDLENKNIRLGLIQRIVVYVADHPHSCLTEIRENVPGKNGYFAGAIRDACKIGKLKSDGKGGYIIPADPSVPSDTHFSGISVENDTGNAQHQNSEKPALALVETPVNEKDHVEVCEKGDGDLALIASA